MYTFCVCSAFFQDPPIPKIFSSPEATTKLHSEKVNVNESNQTSQLNGIVLSPPQNVLQVEWKELKRRSYFIILFWSCIGGVEKLKLIRRENLQIPQAAKYFTPLLSQIYLTLTEWKKKSDSESSHFHFSYYVLFDIFLGGSEIGLIKRQLCMENIETTVVTVNAHFLPFQCWVRWLSRTPFTNLIDR